MNLRDYLAQQQKLVEAHLDRLTPPEAQPPETIHRAMRYSLFAGGKRIRPILCLEAARASGEDPREATLHSRLHTRIHPHLFADPRRSSGPRQ